MADARPCISVLAGTNGAGKSSIAGALVRATGGAYFNPDDAARRLRKLTPGLSAPEANARAWAVGVEQLKSAISKRSEYVFETTLGGNTITNLLLRALDAGLEVRIWYAGLSGPELHIARVAARVAKGGHDIPKADIRRRYVDGQRNLIRLIPRLTELQIYDNSADADPSTGARPKPVLVLHMREGKIHGPRDLRTTPEWAKALVAAALKLQNLKDLGG